jgi:hypothetical protein
MLNQEGVKAKSILRQNSARQKIVRGLFSDPFWNDS